MSAPRLVTASFGQAAGGVTFASGVPTGLNAQTTLQAILPGPGPYPVGDVFTLQQSQNAYRLSVPGGGPSGRIRLIRAEGRITPSRSRVIGPAGLDTSFHVTLGACFFHVYAWNPNQSAAGGSGNPSPADANFSALNAAQSDYLGSFTIGTAPLDIVAPAGCRGLVVTCANSAVVGFVGGSILDMPDGTVYFYYATAMVTAVFDA